MMAPPNMVTMCLSARHGAKNRLDDNSIIGDIYIIMSIDPREFLPLHANWFHILLSLVGKEQHGYGIMQEVIERTNGTVRLWPATLYGSLKRLISGGLIEESEERPAPELDDARRRYY